MTSSRTSKWTLAIVSLGLFMVVLDNLVVNVALPSIHRDLGASIQALEWTVNAYVLAYAVFLLTGAALGDRFGRKRIFAAGIALFTLSSAAAALAPGEDGGHRPPAGSSVPRCCCTAPPRKPRSQPVGTGAVPDLVVWRSTRVQRIRLGCRGHCSEERPYDYCGA